jgi:drug/metabolite transporter (DMT)-like permease
MIVSFLLLILFTILGALGSFCFKKAAFGATKSIFQFFNKYIILGIFFYVASAILNIIVLLELPYTVVLPCSSITYIWSLYLSKSYLNENVGPLKIIGVIFIFLGAALIANN